MYTAADQKKEENWETKPISSRDEESYTTGKSQAIAALHNPSSPGIIECYKVDDSLNTLVSLGPRRPDQRRGYPRQQGTFVIPPSRGSHVS